ncbi:unnamed protein product [Boreogadus saida]
MRAVPLRRRWVKAFSRGCGAEAAQSHGGSAIHLRGGSNAACKWTPIRVRFAGPFRKPRYLRGGSGAEYFCYLPHLAGLKATTRGLTHCRNVAWDGPAFI